MNKQQQESRINDALYEIHRNISANLSGKYLAEIAAYSEQHFHRIFKKLLGETVNVYIRRTRLEHAANQLMFDHESNILEIAEKCGFSSLSSFNKVFKTQFGSTPGAWRSIDRHDSNPPYLLDQEIQAGYQRVQNKKLPSPEILKIDDLHVAYVRHQGYSRDIRKAWLLLKAWVLETHTHSNFKEFDSSLSDGQQIGIHHSNPEWVTLEECRYVACMTIKQPLRKRGSVNSFTIPGGIHAVFTLQGRYGELLPYIGKILNSWLPNSGYKLQTTPIFVHYKKNHFLSTDDIFEVRLFLPITVL